MGDICDKLRLPIGDSWTPDPTYDLRHEAATHIERIDAERDALREALRPFVDLRSQNGAWGVISKKLDAISPLTVTVTKAQMLAACQALNPTEPTS